jgi:hypothetical protein
MLVVLMYEKQLIISWMKQKLHDLEQCNFQFERLRKVFKRSFLKFKKRSKSGQKLARLFESWQEEILWRPTGCGLHEYRRG